MCPRRRDAPRRPTEPAKLAADLRGQILRGQLAPGTPLREEALAEAHGLSRHTVRTALATLVSDRLATQVPYQGIRVRSFTAADLTALQELRCALEVEAVRLTTAKFGLPWPEPVIAPITQALADLADAAATAPDDWPALAAAHAAVHRAIVAGAVSPRIEEAYERLDSEMLLLVVNMRPTYSAAELVGDHRAYLDAVMAPDAGPVVRAHLDRGTSLVAPRD